jgi:hypothetical protein
MVVITVLILINGVPEQSVKRTNKVDEGPDLRLCNTVEAELQGT